MTPKVQNQKYQAYATATQTIARTKQIVMLYDGVIRFMQQAREAIREKRIEDRYHALTKASGIVVGLQTCLDFENGGDIAKVLSNFYSTIDSRIFSLHRQPSPEMCDEIIAEMKKMREVWQEIDEKTSGAPASEAPKPTPASAAGGAENVTFSA